MSTYESTSVAVRATPTNAELIAELITQELGAPSAWVQSTQIQAARAALATGDSSLIHAALASPAMSCSIIDQRKVSDLRSGLHAGAANLAEANSSLSADLLGAQRIMERAERRGITMLARRALHDLRFAVRVGEGQTMSAVEARRGHAVLLLRVDDGGHMVADWMGHSGDDCQRDMAEVQRAFRHAGIDVAVLREVRHGNANGGTLIDQAVAKGGRDLVAGVLASDDGALGAAPVVEALPPRPQVKA